MFIQKLKPCKPEMEELSDKVCTDSRIKGGNNGFTGHLCILTLTGGYSYYCVPPFPHTIKIKSITDYIMLSLKYATKTFSNN